MPARKRPFASARVTGGTGALTRTRGVLSCYREGAGIYHLVFPAARGIRAGEFDVTLTPLGAAARIVQAGDAGGQVPPVGANAPAGATSMKVLAFNDANVATDADFSFAADRA